jgi:hypothetical protein
MSPGEDLQCKFFVAAGWQFRLRRECGQLKTMLANYNSKACRITYAALKGQSDFPYLFSFVMDLYKLCAVYLCISLLKEKLLSIAKRLLAMYCIRSFISKVYFSICFWPGKTKGEAIQEKTQL